MIIPNSISASPMYAREFLRKKGAKIEQRNGSFCPFKIGKK